MVCPFFYSYLLIGGHVWLVSGIISDWADGPSMTGRVKVWDIGRLFLVVFFWPVMAFVVTWKRRA